jgi:hypothetical protein
MVRPAFGWRGKDQRSWCVKVLRWEGEADEQLGRAAFPGTQISRESKEVKRKI